MVQYSRDDLRSIVVYEKDHAGLKEAVDKSAKPESKVGQRFSRPSGEKAVPITN